MKFICACLLSAASLAMAPAPVVAATTGPDCRENAFLRVVAGYMFEVSGAKFSEVTVPGRSVLDNPDGYWLSSERGDVALHAGETANFSAAVAYFYLGFRNPLQIRASETERFPAVFTLTDASPTSSVTVTAELVIYEPDVPLPLPGSAWGLLAGIGGLVAVRRRQARG